MEENVSGMNTVNKGDNGKFIIKPKINDVEIPMELIQEQQLFSYQTRIFENDSEI
ncbi:hypothetical protein DPMN_056391 [Dreissena polymorpha]|uniref:Uncharacterized protein n=1 Tax=Dreissena polymorpha TaxID=45954 RepID=A0A9D4HTK1_DREPO|nr:hypothetical protein DPMN_056391 [Dreissena polymorpha]